VRDIPERLRDIQEAITRITKYTNQGRHLFDQDELVQMAESFRFVEVSLFASKPAEKEKGIQNYMAGKEEQLAAEIERIKKGGAEKYHVRK